MSNIYSLFQTIEQLEAPQGGVFSISDLKTFVKTGDESTFYRTLKKLVENDILKKFGAGYYITQNFNPEVLCQRLCTSSYISFGTILAKNLVIGSIPANRFWCVKIGPSREYICETISVIQLGIQKKYFFGFENVNGICSATKEKAFLDTLYFYQLGIQFSFNIYQDINLQILDKQIINAYLKKYENPKFISFVKGIINE